MSGQLTSRVCAASSAAGEEEDLISRLPTPSRRVAKALIRAGAMANATTRAWPDFLIIGAKRCGTTSLFNYLLQHPSVLPLVPARQRIKGLYFFDVHFAKGPRWYRSHFPTLARLGQVREAYGAATTGEASPYYLAHPLAAERARRLLPDAKIIVLLRNPVERAYSHYREQVRRGFEHLDFAAALDAETGRLDGEEERLRDDPSAYSFPHEHFAYVSRGCYVDQLGRWLAYYSPQQVLVLRSEDMYADPARVYESVLTFLGQPVHRPNNWPKHNFHQGQGIDPEIRARLAERYRTPNRRLEELVGRSFNWDG